MTDGTALLRAVIANPADDTVRLVFADWLDEHDDTERAEFIRGQIKLAGMEPWTDGHTALDVRCRQLKRAHPEWLDGAGDLVSVGERFCGQREDPFKRGFLTRVKLTPAEFAKRRTLFDENPITNVQFALEKWASSGWAKQSGKAWLKQPALARLTGAEFAYFRDSGRVKEVLDCLERLRPLEHFGLVGSRPDAAGAQAVLAHPTVAGVKSLRIGGTPLAEDAEKAFMSAEWPNLRSLTRVWITDAEWLRRPFIRPLRELRASDTEPNLDPARRGVLAEVLPDTEIESLELGWWELDAAGGRALSAALARSRVRSFAMGQTRTRLDVANALITPESLAGLRALYLSWAELDADIISRLAGSELRVCALDHVTGQALNGLLKSPGLPHLTELRLGLTRTNANDRFGDRLRAVLEAGTLPKLLSLTVCDSTPRRDNVKIPPGDEVAEALAKCPAAAQLRELQLVESVTKAGAATLANSPHLAGLQLLNVRVWPKDADADKLLQERFGASVYLDTVSREF